MMNATEHGQRRLAAIERSHAKSLVHFGEIAPALIVELGLTVTEHDKPRQTFMSQVGTRGFHQVTIPGKQKALLKLIKRWYVKHGEKIAEIWPIEVLNFLHDFQYAAGAHGQENYPTEYYNLALSLLDRMGDKVTGTTPKLVFALKTRKVMLTDLERNSRR